MVQKQKIGLVRLGIIWRKMIALMDETSQALVHSAFSTLIRVNNDYACVVSDSKGQLLAQSSYSIPSFIGTIPFTLRSMLQQFPPDDLYPGDVLITNDPWIGTGHLNDISVAMPIFYKDKFIGFVANVAHHDDIGGSSSPHASEHFEEGLLIPIVKLMEKGRKNPAVENIIKANVRTPEINLGDLSAQIASLHAGSAKICELLKEEGLDDLEYLSQEIIGRSEAAMRRNIRNFLKEGSYESEIFADGFEEPLRIKATITVKDGSVAVDYTGTCQQIDKAANSVMNYTFSYTAYALKCILDPTMPNNDGSIRPISVTAPEGTLVNPRRPAAVWGRHTTGHYFPAVIFNALSQAVPDKVMAESGSCPIWTVWFRARRQDGTDIFNGFFMNGGHGAHPTFDGAHTMSFPTNISNTPTEMFENLMPIKILKRELIPDSCGAGKYRGGCGQEISFQIESERGVQVAFRNDRIINPPQGMLGGVAGEKGKILLNGTSLPGKSSLSLKKGDLISFFTPGGAGMFSPKERDPHLVTEDLRNEIITWKYAERYHDYKDK
ncbi:MAG: hydantoinase B/oxoprolinase family protein [Deltaproteobacteria bacterium]|nr:hydantoinase B/oxoprolinase family protein [Deltaproteobacteria bacterium]MBW2152942.1 hydantoinase B/oxoprolinase family protein [Deltaproteobacteria bacterium]